MEVVAQVRVAIFAHLAAPTGLSGIDGNPHSRLERFKIPPHRIVTNSFDYSGKLMPQGQRRLKDIITNPAIFVAMQITATDADGGYVQQYIAGAGRAGMRNLVNP